MKKTSIIAIGALVVAGLFLTSVVLAGVGNNEKNGFQVNGKHYTLNIHGAKNVGDVGDSSGHTMFVPLHNEGKPTKIIMTQDPDGVFHVTDRNALDDGVAEFNIASGTYGTYNIYARALGKPGGKVEICSYGEFQEPDTTNLLWLGCVKVADTTREKGKPKSVNINELFYVDVTLCIAVDPVTKECIETVVYKDFWVFDIEELIEYYWEYDNKGLKLLQVRFYECQLINPDDPIYENDPANYPKDYCRWGDGTAIKSTKNGVGVIA